MPKPDNITAERQAVWDANFEALKANPPDGLPSFLLTIPHFKPVYDAGEWLREELLAIGCPETLVGDLCFANGQRTAFRPDPWLIAAESLERWKSGVVDKPGNELGAELANSVFGLDVTPDEFDPGNQLFEDLKAK